MVGLLVLCYSHSCQSFSVAPAQRLDPFRLRAHQHETTESSSSSSSPRIISRRDALAAVMTTGIIVAAAPIAALAADTDDCGLQNISLGNGRWTKVMSTTNTPNSNVPATFSTYASRFLVNYDQGAASWWQGLVKSFSLLPPDEQQSKLGRSFGRLARSIQIAMEQSLQEAATIEEGYQELLLLFLKNYGDTEEARRHIGLLFATLPNDYQPTKVMSRVSYKTLSTSNVKGGDTKSEVAIDLPTDAANPPPQSMMNDFTVLFPPEFECVRVRGTDAYTIFPPISLYEVGIDEEFGQTATATATGPLAAVPLKRELPDFTASMYTLFGISGAAGCVLTHTFVIPLDVVKTRMQTDPDAASRSLIESASNIVENEGIEGLLLGAQATAAGYMWYGASVYPSYTFFKRWIGQSLLSPEMSIIHHNDVALMAGALAAVIASLGLTPVEAARIRTVAEPEIYRQKGLLGTLQVIATEDPILGWKTLYAGLPSLLTRQVIFGSIKFLAFERACEAIFRVYPNLHDATWTTLLVSLVAGGFSGALSSVVSQPADSVLTYVAQNSSGNLGVLEGSRIMVEKEGVGSLFRGLGSRCVWAGSIIAGQFLLYDVFRTYFGVNGEDLSQVFEVVISGGQAIN